MDPPATPKLSQSQPKIFQQFQGPGNLITIHDGVFYVWNNSKQTILRALCTDIWNTPQDSNAPEKLQTKEWMLSSPVPFKVSAITVRKNKKNEPLCLLWGLSGAAIVTIPILQQSKVPTAYTKILGEKIYLEHPKLQILQAKFHPSPRHEVVLILNNDAYIRCYNLIDPTTSCSVVCVGPHESIPFHYPVKKIGLVTDEPPIDFDFGPHLTSSHDLWSVFVLKGSGAVSYMCMKIIEPTKRIHWESKKPVEISGDFGELIEYPTTFWVSKTFPVYMVLGSLDGNLYHCVLLPNAIGDNVNIEQEFLHGEQSTTMFVKEVLELEPDSALGFLQLVPDPLCPYRYACVHPEGVHLITMNWVPMMKKILYGSGGSSFEETEAKSSSRHIVFHKGRSTSGNGSSGACFSDLVPQKFLSIDAGEILGFEIPKYMGFKPTAESPSSFRENKQKTFSNESTSSVIDEITNLLSKTKNQPFLSCGDELTPPQRENILQESIRTLQTEYVNKQEQAISFIKLYLTNLKEQVEDVRRGPIEQLKSTVETIETQTSDLETKYNEIARIESIFSKRIEQVISVQQHSFPIFTDEEKLWARVLQDLEKELEQLKEQVKGLQDRSKSIPSPIIVSSPRSNNSSRGTTNLFSTSELVDIKVKLLEQQKQLIELKDAFKDVTESISV